MPTELYICVKLLKSGEKKFVKWLTNTAVVNVKYVAIKNAQERLVFITEIQEKKILESLQME